MSQIPSTSDLLEQDLKAIYSNMFKQYQKTEKDLESYADTLLDWLKTQPHLPETDNRALVKKFLLLNKFSVEKTKAKLDMYYTIRRLVPEFFKNPNTAAMIQQRRAASVLALPKLTKNFNRIILSRVAENCPPANFYRDEMYANMLAIMEVLANEDMSFQVEVIFDQVHAKIEHVPGMDFMAMRKGQKVFEKVFSNRIAVIHLVNIPSYFVSVLNVTKKMMPAKLAERFRIHSDPNALFEYYSRDMLPTELGGTGPSIATLTDMWDKKFLEYADRFEKLEKMEVDESLRPEPLKNDDILGWHGNFKKLDVD